MRKGFTLVELIVVIAIIGLLATVGITSYNMVLNNSKTTKASADLKEFKSAIEAARIKTGSTLMDITGNGCSACLVCTGDLRNVAATHGCVVAFENVITTVSSAGGFDITALGRDPWGSPYVIDENDGEYESNPCRPDTLRSVGPDGTYGSADDIIINLRTISPGC